MGVFVAINIFSKGTTTMAMANIDALVAELATLKESLRIKLQSLQNIDPRYQMNQAYIAKLQAEVASLQAQIAQDELLLQQASTPTPITPTRPALDLSSQQTPTVQTPYDDDGNLNPGWRINPDTGEPFYAGQPPIALDPETIAEAPLEEFSYSPLEEPPDVPYDEFGGLDEAIAAQENGLEEPPDIDPEEDPYEAARLQREEDYNNIMPSEDEIFNASGGYRAISQPLQSTRQQATAQDIANFNLQKDWRVRLSLANGQSVNYLYKSPNPGILAPLVATNGVVFPYTPNIAVTYAASYEPSEFVHNNYKFYQYKNSSVDQITITCDFTAQDIKEATYLLAVIHFFRSATKMFYGQDQNPSRGTPPPLCYLTGLGAFQFDTHPLAITSFTYNLPTDVDYIRAAAYPTTTSNNINVEGVGNYTDRLQASGAYPGAVSAPPSYQFQNVGTVDPTYVPTKMQMQIGAVPMLSRNQVSNKFSLRDYANGKLLQGSKNSTTGMW